ncbi:MAG: MAPEG family protein [Stenotrophobium sp.]
MTQTAILFPMMALAAWTFIVLSLMPYRRFKAASKKQVVMDDFKFGESGNVPPEVSIPNRNYMNLLELPVLFYVACLTLYVTKNLDSVVLYAAWVYVVLRVCHSLVHLTYNKVAHRLGFFAVSNAVLIVVWIRLFIALLR